MGIRPYLGILIAGLLSGQVTTVPVKESLRESNVRINANFAHLNEKLASVRDFGATCDGATLAAAVAASKGRKLTVPPGVCSTDRPITLPNDFVLECEPGAVIKAIAAMDYVVGMPTASYATQNFAIRNCIVDAASLATNAIYVHNIAYMGGLQSVWGKNAAGDGIVIHESMGGTFTDLRASGNGGAGIALSGSNASKVFGVNAYQNTGDGVRIEKTAGGSGGTSLFGVRSENNGRHGVYVVDTFSPVVIDGGWLEANAGDGVRIGTNCVRVSGLRISGNGTGANRGISVIGAVKGLHVQANYIARSAGDTNYSPIATDSAVTDSVLGPNYSLVGATLDGSNLAPGTVAP